MVSGGKDAGGCTILSGGQAGHEANGGDGDERMHVDALDGEVVRVCRVEMYGSVGKRKW